MYRNDYYFKREGYQKELTAENSKYKSACYCSCLIGDLTKNATRAALDYCVQRGWCDADFYVTNPVAIYNHFHPWEPPLTSVVKETSLTPGRHRFLVGRYSYGEKSHFVVVAITPEGEYEVVYDPWADSETIRNGKLESLRCFD